MAKTITTGFISGVIDGLGIDSSLKCNSGNYNNLGSRNVAYIVMHYTGNQKDTAIANAKYFQGANRKASAHFFVDDNSIYQSVELRDTAWHCGTSGTYYHSSCRNANSIGIEQCCTAGNYRISDLTKRHAAHLCAHLCTLIGITADTVDTYVVRHYDVTHKSCPAQMAGAGNAEWTAFKTMVKQILGGQTISSSAASASKQVDPYTVTVTADSLNVRSGPGTGYDPVSSVKTGTVCTIVEEADGWGKLKDGTGWIKLSYTKKTGAGVTAAVPATPTASTATSGVPYLVRITASSLNVRSGAGVSFPKTTSVSKGGVYTIVEEKVVSGGKWGKLKSGVGWISLAYTTKV